MKVIPVLVAEDLGRTPLPRSDAVLYDLEEHEVEAEKVEMVNLNLNLDQMEEY
ncbi:hypothetical protein [Candidatus Hecatella orcuttiae]|jgi:hypothetical protein|uniref:hypothetical protein n=1 Tax=Candidatus Hecatella orcuttiae TaxID=1935119 RepID=UPI0028683A69|nr:hypothetical protein [Candidatus Hecatella orcuttiae]